ncbi:hypothetical protein FALCPG4_000612 [Fusarium falciforme]
MSPAMSITHSSRLQLLRMASIHGKACPGLPGLKRWTHTHTRPAAQPNARAAIVADPRCPSSPQPKSKLLFCSPTGIAMALTTFRPTSSRFHPALIKHIVRSATRARFAYSAASSLPRRDDAL